VKGSIVVHRNIEDVFDFLRSPENLIDKERMDWVNFDADGAVGGNSTFNANFKIGPVTRTAKYEVSVYEPPYKLGLLIKGLEPPPVPPMEDVIELKAAPGGTRLTRKIWIEVQKPGRLDTWLDL
jgi:carbon monoxide dehydrogenase subunit G